MLKSCFFSESVPFRLFLHKYHCIHCFSIKNNLKCTIKLYKEKRTQNPSKRQNEDFGTVNQSES